MSRIHSVSLQGFKGQDRTYELGTLTLLSGPNGLGKSAVLEGLRYAVSGEVPAGKALDAVARYFPPRGGSVVVTDEEGNWIRRGIVRDHEKAKISEDFEQEGDADWSANEALLDMRNFTGLSENRRREFALQLVGAGSTPTEKEIHAALALDYARQVGGPGADTSILDGRSQDLPEDLQPVADRWLALWGVLKSYLKTGEQTASAVFQRLADASRERKNAARVAANEAKAAIRELEAEARGAEAAAADVERRALEAAESDQALVCAREAAAARREVQTALEAAERDLGEIERSFERTEAALADLSDPGERPEVPSGESEDARRYRAEAEAAAEKSRQAAEARRELEATETHLAAAEAALEVARRDVATLEAEPIGRAVAAADQVREVGYLPHTRIGGLVGDLLTIVDELATSWKTRQTVAVERVAEHAERAGQLAGRCRDLTKKAPSVEEYKGLVAQAVDLDGKERAAVREWTERTQTQRKALSEWEAETRRQETVRAEAKSARERYDAARAREKELSGRLADMGSPDVEAATDAAGAARKALSEAEKAAGALAAYRAAVKRAKSEKISEKAWKAAEAACKRARETYVAEVVAPLVDDVAALLRAAGRPERVYLELENERGRPVFDMGWDLGDSRRSLSALSGGEAVLFTTALALTIARRALGRRVLLIEADPLDETNLWLLLEALTDLEGELDACLLATSTPVEEKEGWKVVRFGEVAKT